MRRWWRRTGRTVAMAVAVLVAGLAVPAAHAATERWTVTQNLLPGLARAADLGPAPSGTPMTLLVSVARPDPAGEQALLDAEHNPANPRFGHFLSVDDFIARFGVQPSQVDKVTSWLTGTGLRVDSVSAAGDQIAVRGTAGQISGLFGTPIHRFSSPAGAFLANTAAPVLPYGLGINNVIGLNTLQRLSPPARRHQDGCLASTCTGVTTPADLWNVYRQPAAYQGQGQSIAIFGNGRTDGVINDLRAFEQKFGLPRTPVTVRHPANDTNFADDSGHEEWNIDTQAATGMAPRTSGLSLYFGQDLSDSDVTKMFSMWTDDRTGPKQASASFGECETVPAVSPIAGQPVLNNPSLPAGQGLGNNSDSTWTQILRQAAIEGKTLFSSTGDTGSSCPVAYAQIIGAGNGVLNQGVPVTNSPASLPYVVGVGGTVLYTDGAGRRSREYGWAFSGGGSTLFHPAPSYQRGTPGLSVPCVTNPLAVCRGIADVSAQSGDVATNGYAIVSNGATTVGGGTSLSSPLWAGMWARVQGASRNAGGNGFANYALYRVGKDTVSNPRDFFDVSSTDTATGVPATNGLYPTLPGWDYVTGWGTPKVDGLICDLDHKGC
jgi:pseudomonalisin